MIRVFLGEHQREELTSAISSFLAELGVFYCEFSSTEGGWYAEFHYESNMPFPIDRFRQVADLPSASVERRDTAAKVVYDEPITADECKDIVNSLLSEKAVEYGYDSIVSVCSYASSGVEKFRREGEVFSFWRDAMWSTCFSAIENGVACLEDFLSSLPPFPEELLSQSGPAA